MRQIILAIAAVFSFSVAAVNEAQLAYEPKMRVADKGESYQVIITHSMKMTTTKVIEDSGKVPAEQKKVANSKSYVYKTTVLAKAADALHPAASKREYEKAEVTDNGNTRPSTLQGKTVILQKKGDKFEHRFEGGVELTTDQLQDLDNQPAISVHAQAFMPEKPVVWPDGKWALEPALLVKMAPGELAAILDVAKGEAVARLKTGNYKGNPPERIFYGTIEVRIEIPLKVGADLNGVKVKSGKVVFTTTIDGRVDGKSVDRTQKGMLELDMQGSQEANGMTFAVRVEMSRTTEETYTGIDNK